MQGKLLVFNPSHQFNSILNHMQFYHHYLLTLHTQHDTTRLDTTITTTAGIQDHYGDPDSHHKGEWRAFSLLIFSLCFRGIYATMSVHDIDTTGHLNCLLDDT